MSWSFQAVGKPAAVVKAIEESSNNKLTGKSLDEWQEAKPALLALVGANVGNAVKVNASGSASWDYKSTPDPQEKTSGQCSCVIESLYGFVE